MIGRSTSAPEASRAARLSRLPLRVRAIALSLSAAASLPPAAVLLSVGGDRGSTAAAICGNPGVVHVASLLLVVAVLLALEPPRTASPIGYARQLRARFIELQSTFDAEDRRRPEEGKEMEDDRVPSEP